MEDEASDEKNRIEEKQRMARRKRQEANIVYKPHYFEKVTESETEEISYRYIRDYWKDREQGNWGHLADLFSHDEED